MGPANAKLSMLPEKVLASSRLITLFASIFVGLGSGTNYVYSAYAPQLGARLQVSHTQLNIIGLAANMSSISSPIWGRIVDRGGPRIPLIGSSFFLFFGYLGIKKMYDDGTDDGLTISPRHLVLLVACSFIMGLGSHGGISAAINATAKSFPSGSRATTTSLVLSGYGLSAFCFSQIGRMLFPGNTSAFLLILAIGTATPMLIGLFTIKAVPPVSTTVKVQSSTDGYDLIPSRDVADSDGGPQVMLGTVVGAGVDGDPAQYVPYEVESPVSLYPEGGIGEKDVLPDIHGKQLWLTPDFYLLFVIIAICGGTGLMYINNVGSISQALYAKAHPVYDDTEASQLQVAQVSILSIGNFSGRVLIGLISDFIHTRLRLPRAYSLCIVSTLFIISLVTAITVSSAETLWIATLLLGLAYGSLFGGSPAILIEWFGIAHFSENSGFISFSPVIGGNLFSLMFGYELDTHTPAQDPPSSLMTRAWSLMSRSGLPSEHQCFDGKACYSGSLQVALVACIASLGLSWWAGIRDGQKLKARNAHGEYTELSLRS